MAIVASKRIIHGVLIIFLNFELQKVFFHFMYFIFSFL